MWLRVRTLSSCRQCRDAACCSSRLGKSESSFCMASLLFLPLFEHQLRPENGNGRAASSAFPNSDSTMSVTDLICLIDAAPSCSTPGIQHLYRILKKRKKKPRGHVLKRTVSQRVTELGCLAEFPWGGKLLYSRIERESSSFWSLAICWLCCSASRRQPLFSTLRNITLETM